MRQSVHQGEIRNVQIFGYPAQIINADAAPGLPISALPICQDRSDHAAPTWLVEALIAAGILDSLAARSIGSIRPLKSLHQFDTRTMGCVVSCLPRLAVTDAVGGLLNPLFVTIIGPPRGVARWTSLAQGSGGVRLWIRFRLPRGRR